MEALIISLVCLVTFVGGIISKQIQGGSLPFWSYVIPAIINGLLWGYSSKLTSHIARLSIIFDVCISVSYMLGLIIMGERLSLVQVLGFGVALIGLAMMG